MKYVYAAESYLTRDVMVSHCYLHEDGHIPTGHGFLALRIPRDQCRVRRDRPIRDTDHVLLWLHNGRWQTVPKVIQAWWDDGLSTYAIHNKILSETIYDANPAQGYV